MDDPSLQDIIYLLDPIFTKSDIDELDHSELLSLTLHGESYVPGVVGLNDIKLNDSMNCVLLSMAHLKNIRDFFLLPENYTGCKSRLVNTFGEFVRKLWNRRNFKAQVSPHEILNAVSVASKKHFQIGEQADPNLFLGWFLNELHTGLIADGKKKKKTIITSELQGEVEIVTEKNVATDAEKESGIMSRIETTTAKSKFFFLTLDLPPAPLFKDELERNIIPQVPLMVLLEKFNGINWTELPIEHARKQFIITKLPRYLILHVKRFTNNRFFLEKNPTIVIFPVKNLDLSPYVKGATAPIKYDLVSTIRHEGQPQKGRYGVSVCSKALQKWYDINNLVVSETHPQKLSLSESYMLFYERQQHDQPTE